MDKLLKVREVAELLSMSVPTIYKLIQLKELGHVRASTGAVRVRPDQLQDYIERNSTDGKLN